MINEFYSDKTILLTGGTGFLGKPLIRYSFSLGKVVLEKILRSLPTIKKIYLAITPKVSLFGHVSTQSSSLYADVRTECRVRKISERNYGVINIRQAQTATGYEGIQALACK